MLSSCAARRIPVRWEGNDVCRNEMGIGAVGRPGAAALKSLGKPRLLRGQAVGAFVTVTFESPVVR